MENKKRVLVDLKNFEKCPEIAEVKMSYKTKFKNFIKISSSKDSFDVLFPLFDKDLIEFKEEFFLIMLNRANKFLGWVKISSGGTQGTVVDVKIIFMLALLTNASSIIIGHNHPSQNIQPSQADIEITKKVKEAGIILGINVLDHLIVSANGTYFTFADEGLL